MFTVNNSITDLKVKERNIFKIIYSMNSHPVATPEMSVEEARCYILFFSEGANLSSYIGLYLPRTDRKFFYSYTSNPFPFEAGADVENEARQFAEDMGFLLDEINVSGMAVEDRNHWIEDQYIFGYKKPEQIEGEEAAPDEENALPEESAGAPHPAEPAPVPAAPPATAPAVAAPAAPATAVHPAPAAAPAAAPPAPPPQPEQPAPQPYYPGYPPQQGQPYPPQYPTQQGQPFPPQQPYPGYPPQQYSPQGQPYPPQQPYPGYPQQPGQPYPQQYPPQQGQPGMPPYQQARQQPPVLDVPELEEPVAPPPARVKAAPPPKPAAKKKAPASKPAPSQRKPAPEEVEEELAVEVQIEAAPRQPHSLMEEAIRQGVVRPPKQKVQAGLRSATGTVARDKEALARLLSSF